MKKFSVISNGEVLPGFERDQVIADLAQSLNVSSKIIDAMLVNESSRRLQSVDSRLAADKMVFKFQSMGLKCSVLENQSGTTRIPNVSQPVETKNSQNRGIGKWFLALFLVWVVVCVVLFLINR